MPRLQSSSCRAKNDIHSSSTNANNFLAPPMSTTKRHRQSVSPSHNVNQQNQVLSVSAKCQAPPRRSIAARVKVSNYHQKCQAKISFGSGPRYARQPLRHVPRWHVPHPAKLASQVTCPDTPAPYYKLYVRPTPIPCAPVLTLRQVHVRQVLSLRQFRVRKSQVRISSVMPIPCSTYSAVPIPCSTYSLCALLFQV